MLRYTIKRLLQSVITIFLIATAVFVLMRMLPVEYYFDEDERMYLTDEQQEAILQEAGFMLIRFREILENLGEFKETHRFWS